MSRRAATRVLFRVATDGAWATPTLDAEIRRAGLSRVDAALATEIVFGALRVLPTLDELLDGFLKSPSQTDPMLRAALWVGAYQLLYLSRVPAHAAVGETVGACRGERGAKLAGVANAVLRKVARLRPEQPARPDRLVLPAWMDGCVRRGLGDERADVFLGARRLPPPIGLRVTGDRDAFAARIEGEVDRSALVPQGLAVRGVGDPRELPGYGEGAFAVQELGSQRAVDLLGARPGERIADLCCGHGGKTFALAQRVGAEGSVVAVDLYEEKLDRLAIERRRLGFDASRIHAHAIDLTRGLGGLDEASFDRVLVDAPCTGLGTIHRRPELALRLGPSDPARLGELQRAILVHAARLVKDGGTLALATCSVAHEEGLALKDAVEGEPTFEQIGPWLGEELDAYQILTWHPRMATVQSTLIGTGALDTPEGQG